MTSIRRKKAVKSYRNRVFEAIEGENEQGNECLKYYDKDPNTFRAKNLPCGNRPWRDGSFHTSAYVPKDMNAYINEHFSNERFDGKSPFTFQSSYKFKNMTDICDRQSFELSPPQKFLAQFMNNQTDFNGILVYHNLGAGKSVTSILIGEAMKSKALRKDEFTNRLKGRSPYRVYLVVPKAVKGQFFDEIVGKVQNGSFFSATAACVITNNNDADLESKRQVYVGNYIPRTKTYRYEILNEVEKLGQEIQVIQTRLQGRLPKTERANLMRELTSLEKRFETRTREIHGKVDTVYHIISHDKFLNEVMTNDFQPTDFLLTDGIFRSKNSLLIIDEIQKLVRDEGSKYMRLFYTLNVYARDPSNGEPRMRVVLLTATPIYDNPHEAALMINLLRPRIPFPLNDSRFRQDFVEYTNFEPHLKNRILLKYLFSGYVSYFRGGNPKGYPVRRNHFKFHKMGKYQQKFYIDSMVKEMAKLGTKIFRKIDRDQMGEENGRDIDTGLFTISTQKCNIVIPSKTNSTITTNEDLKMFKTNLSKTDPSKVFDFLQKYSPKFVEILKLAIHSEGPVFIYSRWISHGIIPLAFILEQGLGWEFLRGTSNLAKPGINRFSIWSPGGLTFKGFRTEQAKDAYIQYMRNVFNSTENKNGSLCKIMLSNIVEGISLKNVRQVHLCEPWWNISKMEQIVARGIRLCSHASLPKREQFVDVYYHVSTMREYPEFNPTAITKFSSIDRRLAYFRDYSRSSLEQKMFIAANRKQVLNVQFEILMKLSSVDCNLNKKGNLIRLEKTYIPFSTDREVVALYYNRTNNKYYKLDENDRSILEVEINDKMEYDDVNYPIASWPPNTYKVLTDKRIRLAEWKYNSENQDIIMYENSFFDTSNNPPFGNKCDINNLDLDFMGTLKSAIQLKEEIDVWKTYHDSYLKTKYLGPLLTRYKMTMSRTSGKLPECLLGILKESSKTDVWNRLSEKDRRRHIHTLETTLLIPRAIAQKEMLIKRIKNKVDPAFRQKISDYSYAELQDLDQKLNIASRIGILSDYMDAFLSLDLRRIHKKVKELEKRNVPRQEWGHLFFLEV